MKKNMSACRGRAVPIRLWSTVVSQPQTPRCSPARQVRRMPAAGAQWLSSSLVSGYFSAIR